MFENAVEILFRFSIDDTTRIVFLRKISIRKKRTSKEKSTDFLIFFKIHILDTLYILEFMYQTNPCKRGPNDIRSKHNLNN